MPDTRGAADLGDFSKLSREEKEALAAQAKDAGTKPIVQAFVVVVGEDGSAQAFQDPKVLAQFDAQPATVAQICNACHAVLDDMVASKAASATVMTLQQQAMAAAEQAKNQKIMAAAQAAQNGHR